jgi:hypothetical protein
MVRFGRSFGGEEFLEEIKELKKMEPAPESARRTPGR